MLFNRPWFKDAKVADSQLSWSETIQLPYLFHYFCSYLFHKFWCICLCCRIFGSFYKTSQLLTNIFPSPNSNGCPSTNPGLLTNTCSFGGLNIVKGFCVSMFPVYNQVACRSPYVCCCCCC